MRLRKIMGGISVLAIVIAFAAAPVSAAPGDRPADPPETPEPMEENQDHVVGEELC